MMRTYVHTHTRTHTHTHTHARMPAPERRAHVLTNPRIVSAFAAAWCAALGVLYWYCGGTRSDNGYILWSFGPSSELRFIGLTIDTWDKWAVFNALIFVDAIISVWVTEVVLTWLYFEIYDRDKHDVRWGAQTLTTTQALAVALTFNFYTTVHVLIWLYVALTAADTQLLIILTNLVATGVMVLLYLRDKHHNATVAAAAAAAKTANPTAPASRSKPVVVAAAAVEMARPQQQGKQRRPPGNRSGPAYTQLSTTPPLQSLPEEETEE